MWQTTAVILASSPTPYRACGLLASGAEPIYCCLASVRPLPAIETPDHQDPWTSRLESGARLFPLLRSPSAYPIAKSDQSPPDSPAPSRSWLLSWEHPSPHGRTAPRPRLNPHEYSGVSARSLPMAEAPCKQP